MSTTHVCNRPQCGGNPAMPALPLNPLPPRDEAPLDYIRWRFQGRTIATYDNRPRGKGPHACHFRTCRTREEAEHVLNRLRAGALP
jgi:hypothetical protein